MPAPSVPVCPPQPLDLLYQLVTALYTCHKVFSYTSQRDLPNSPCWLLIMKNVLFCLLLLGATGCATNPPNGPVYDPWENTNRKIFKFNTKLDNAILKPVARGYRAVLPDPVENGVSNFFSNLDDVNVVVNDLLQGKPHQAGDAATRVAINTIFGVFGLFDVSTRAGLPKHYENFGQTLGVWGVGEGPYVVLPLFGPRNIRSTTGLIVESQTTAVLPYLTNERSVLWGATALDLVSTRARLLGASKVLDSALDPYLLLRDTYVQQHRQATLDTDERIVLGSASNNDDDLDEIDELDELDEIDELDELDELDKLDELEEAEAAEKLNARQKEGE